MADDLDDEWWLESAEKNDKSDDNSSNAASRTPSPVKEKLKKSSKKDVKAKGNNVKDKGKKRKQETEKQTEVTSTAVTGDEPKKKKKKKTLTEKLKEEDTAPPKPEDLISALHKHFAGVLSPIEWDALNITEANFCESLDSSLNASTYLKLIFPRWKKKVGTMKKENGAPLMLVICPAGIRAAQFNRDVKDFKEDCTSAKLFAKHFKVADQVKFLKKTLVHIAIGTPNRLQSLIDSDALKLSQVKRIVLDWSWRDQKLRRMVDIPEVRKDLFSLIHKHFLPLCATPEVKFALF